MYKDKLPIEITASTLKFYVECIKSFSKYMFKQMKKKTSVANVKREILTTKHNFFFFFFTQFGYFNVYSAQK